MIRQDHRLSSSRRGYSLVEMVSAVGAFSVILAAVYTSSTALLNSMTVSESYSVGQLQAMDYISLDLRRATSFTPSGSGNNLTLPLDLTLPQYYQADGRTPNPAQRTTVTSGNKKDKKQHKVFNALYYYHYGTLGGTVAVRYYLSNGSLYRKEGNLPARIVGTGISGVTFGPTLNDIQADPMVTTTMTFLATTRTKTAPPSLSSTTFMRHFYYNDYKEN